MEIIKKTSNNKARTTYDIVRTVTKNSISNHAISLINIDGRLCSTNQIIAKNFINYFTSLLDKVSISKSKQINKTQNVTDSISYVHEAFK